MALPEKNVRREFEGMTNEELVAQLAWILREITCRLVVYLEVGKDSQEAADAGLLLAARTYRVASGEKGLIFTMKHQLEALGIYDHEADDEDIHVDEAA